MTENFIQYQNTDIFYRTSGSGEIVIMFLHGFGEDGEIWNQQVAFLQNKYRIIVPDIPGSGRSRLVSGASIETYAEIMKAIANAEGLTEAKKIVLLGHSMGGYVTLSFAEKYPEYLRAFGFIHSTAFADPDEKKQVRKKAIEFIKKNGSALFLQTSIPGLFSQAFNNSNTATVSALVDKGKNFSSEALVQYYEAMISRPDRTNVLKTATVPVLFIIGSYDTAVPVMQSMQQCHLPTLSQVSLLENSAHMGMLEETTKVNNSIQQFIESLVQ